MTSQPLNLDEIEARAAAATPGPWTTDGWEIYQGTGAGIPDLMKWVGETCRADDYDGSRNDAAFIAHARTDVPAMTAEIRRLRAQVAAVTAVHEKGEHNGLAICLHCASQMFPPPETGIWSESAYPCATLRALGITEAAAGDRP
jgi:hypothetical protein